MLQSSPVESSPSILSPSWPTSYLFNGTPSPVKVAFALDSYDEIFLHPWRRSAPVFRRGQSFPPKIPSFRSERNISRPFSLVSLLTAASTSRNAFHPSQKTGSRHGRTIHLLTSRSRFYPFTSPQRRSPRTNFASSSKNPTAPSATQTSPHSRSLQTRRTFLSCSMAPPSPSRTLPCNYLETSSSSSSRGAMHAKVPRRSRRS